MHTPYTRCAVVRRFSPVCWPFKVSVRQLFVFRCTDARNGQHSGPGGTTWPCGALPRTGQERRQAAGRHNDDGRADEEGERKDAARLS